MADLIQIRRDTASNWTSANTVLAQGELGAETDTSKIKIGDGSTVWNSLGYLIDAGGYITATSTNTLTNKTLTAPKINENVVLSATATELNVLDGVTATTAEINYNDITTLGTSQASKVLTADANGDVLASEEFKAKSYNETYVAMSANDVDCEAGNFFSKTISSNTTFTFSNPPASDTGYGFVLKLTSSGTNTVTYPAAVDWAGGTAPDAPASGETDILCFITHDAGTTWYGFLAGDAVA